MTMQRTEAAKNRPLDILGISEAEEQAYEWLLAHPGTTAQEISKSLSRTPRKTQNLLDTLETKGLVTHTPEKPRRYMSASPDIALKAFAVRREEELQRARDKIRKLQEVADGAHPRGEREQIVELITSREAESQIFSHLYRGAQHEVVSLVRRPLRVSSLDESSRQDRNLQAEGKARGVRFRGIIDTDFLHVPGATARIRKDSESGENVRVFSNLPFKMVLADRRIALVPLNLERPDSPSLLVRSSALLDALYALFEILWARASPILFTQAGALEISDTGSKSSQLIEDMVSLLAAGLNDQSVAYEMNLSIRTFRRRTIELMKALNARTRFQAGWIAAHQRADHHQQYGDADYAVPAKAGTQ